MNEQIRPREDEEFKNFLLQEAEKYELGKMVQIDANTTGMMARLIRTFAKYVRENGR